MRRKKIPRQHKIFSFIFIIFVMVVLFFIIKTEPINTSLVCDRVEDKEGVCTFTISKILEKEVKNIPIKDVREILKKEDNYYGSCDLELITQTEDIILFVDRSESFSRCNLTKTKLDTFFDYATQKHLSIEQGPVEWPVFVFAGVFYTVATVMLFLLIFWYR